MVLFGCEMGESRGGRTLTYLNIERSVWCEGFSPRARRPTWLEGVIQSPEEPQGNSRHTNFCVGSGPSLEISYG